MTDTRKIVFIRAEKDDLPRIADVLSSLKQTEYRFFLLPINDCIMTRQEVMDMLKRLPEKFSPVE